MSRYFYIFATTLLLLTPLAFTQAQGEFVSITTIPFLNGETPTAEKFVRAAYRLSISVAAMLAVIKIIYGGVQWMLTDVVTSKESAKKDIKGAILGLIIVLCAVFILEILNPKLKTFSLFSNVPALNISGPPASAVAPVK